MSLDRVFYINLDKRTDRRQEIETEIKKVPGLWEKAERFSAIEHPFGCVGCTRSHLEVLRLAKTRGYSQILILEDDFMWINGQENRFNERLLDFDTDYDVVMLTALVIESVDSERENRIQDEKRILKAHNAAGYLIHERMFDRLIDAYEQTWPHLERTGADWIYTNDVVWQRFQPESRWYLVKMGRQRPSYSDISKCFVDHGC
jgi:glycosyl transferase family 25